jgi:hypothetical protein
MDLLEHGAAAYLRLNCTGEPKTCATAPQSSTLTQLITQQPSSATRRSALQPCPRDQAARHAPSFVVADTAAGTVGESRAIAETISYFQEFNTDPPEIYRLSMSFPNHVRRRDRQAACPVSAKTISSSVPFAPH